MSRPQTFCRQHLPAIFLLFLAPGLVRAQGLKTVDNPGGGQIVYGSVVGQTTPQGAMTAALHYAHGSFGDRPKIGIIFQSKDGQTFGVGFSLTAVKLGNKPVAGLVMISMSMGQDPQAALLYDDKTRFPKTQPEMLHTLSQIWAQQMQSAGGSAPQARPPVLHMVSGGDGSGHIGLPDDWHITGMSGGQCTAEGPHGEFIGLGLQYQGIQDPNLRSNLRFNAPGARAGLAYPIGGNLFSAFVNVTNQVLQRAGKPRASFTFVSGKDTPPVGPNEKAVEVHFIVDSNDGRGPRIGSARVGEVYTPGMPTWMMTVQTSNIPKPYVDAEQPTVNAILRTFNQDVGVINNELQQSLANTRAIGERTKIQVDAADARRIGSTAAFNQHMDDLSVASKVQQNYTMDRTELQDNDLALRGAIDNNVATALIKANPDRYQEVPTASFLKGVDY